MIGAQFEYSPHRVHRRKPIYTAEGHPNVNCPGCGYSMVGLHQSRCPECGNRYTLDELLLKQNFRNTDQPGLGQEQPTPTCP